MDELSRPDSTHVHDPDTDSPAPAAGRRRRRRSADGRNATRGQAEVIGAILLFGLVIALLVLIQASAVPSWNQQLEYEHSLRIQEDFTELNSAVDDMSAVGGDRSVVVETSVNYPPRPFLFNPPPAVGSLETPGRGTMTVSNTELVGVDNYWNATERFSSTSIRYRPGYHQYTGGPTMVYENGYTYKRFPGGVVRPLTSTNLVDGNEVNLVVLDGRVSQTQAGSASVDLQPTSAPTQSVTMVSRDGSPLVVRVPTLANESTWRDALRDELDGGDPAVDDQSGRYVADLRVDPGTPFNTLVLTLEPGPTGGQPYELRMAEIGVGRTATRTKPAYVTPESAAAPLVNAGDLETLAVQVRDEYNNPKSNVTVEFATVAGNGTVTPTRVTTGDDGVARTTFVATKAGAATVQARIDVNGDGRFTLTRERTSLSVTVLDAPSGGSGSIPDGVSSLNPGSGSDYPELATVAINRTGADLTFDNEGDRTYTMTEVRIPFYSGTDQQQLSDSPQFAYHGFRRGISVPGGFAAVNGPTLDPNGAAGESDTITFENLDNSPKGDFFILNVVYEDASGTEYRVSYFVGIPMSTR